LSAVGGANVAGQPEREDPEVERDREEHQGTRHVDQLERRNHVERQEQGDQDGDGQRHATQMKPAGHGSDGDHDREDEIRRRRLHPDDGEQQDAERDRHVVAGERQRENREQAHARGKNERERRRLPGKGERQREEENGEENGARKQAQRAGQIDAAAARERLGGDLQRRHGSATPTDSPALAGRPRVLVLITLAEVGGAQSYVCSLLPALADHFDVRVAAYGDGPVRLAAEELGLRFIPLHHVRRPIRPWRDAAGLIELIRLLRRERPHVLHASSSKAGVLGRVAAAFTGVPVRIFTVHGWAFGASAGFTARLYRWADRLMSPLTTATICVSERELNAGVAAGTCDAGRAVVIRNAVQVHGAPRSRLEHEPPRVIAVGRLRPPKDFGTLLTALAHLPPDSFAASIVGDGPLRGALAAQIAKLGLEGRVRLEGERREVAELLADSDVFVLSSRSEGLPVSVVEAMAAGLPVVSSAVGGVAELVVHGQTGLLVPPGDADALAAALGVVVGDAALRRRLGAAGRARAEALFDLSRSRRDHVELYRRELARAGVSRAP
jgi:glycosyltransferase involved in cell wall biosynthesis